MVICSQGLVLATTAMVVSTTVAVLAYSRQKSCQGQESSSSSSPQNQPLRSCLSSSDEGRRVDRRQKKKKKKRVRFAEDVKEPTRGECLELQSRSQVRGGDDRGGCGYCCRDEFARGGMPANRVALYSCILRDRANRMACSY